LSVEAELLKFLKAEQKVAALSDKSLTSEVLPAALSDKSLTSEVLPAACVFVSDKVIPLVAGLANTKYVCVQKCGGEKLASIGRDLCELLKK